MNDILNKAKQKTYKHSSWFSEGTKSVYEAIKYFVDSGDFYLDITVKNTREIPNYQGGSKRTDILKFLIENKLWKFLVIRYGGREKGTDRGELKILTFIELSRIKESSMITEMNGKVAGDMMKIAAMDIMNAFKRDSDSPFPLSMQDKFKSLFHGKKESVRFKTEVSNSDWIKETSMKADGLDVKVDIKFIDRYYESEGVFCEHWIELTITPETTFGVYVEKGVQDDTVRTYEEFSEKLSQTFINQLPTWLTGRTQKDPS